MTTLINESNKEIGEGAFGTVYAVWKSKLTPRLKKLSRTNTDGNPKFPVCYKKCSYRNNQKRLYLEYEILILSELFHKNIVELLGYYHDTQKNCYYMVMPFAGIALQEFVMKELPKYAKHEARAILQINLQLHKVLEYLHIDCGKEIIHRDIKPGNILVIPPRKDTKKELEFIVTVCDFGLAKEIIENDRTQTGVKGTGVYMAPEIIKRKASAEPEKYFTPKVDIYAAGLVLQYMCTRKQLYLQYAAAAKYAKIILNENDEEVHNRVLPVLPSNFPNGLRTLSLRYQVRSIERSI